MEYLLVIPGRLDNLNDFIRADKSSRYKGGELKANNERIVPCKLIIGYSETKSKRKGEKNR